MKILNIIKNKINYFIYFGLAIAVAALAWNLVLANGKIKTFKDDYIATNGNYRQFTHCVQDVRAFLEKQSDAYLDTGAELAALLASQTGVIQIDTCLVPNEIYKKEQ